MEGPTADSWLVAYRRLIENLVKCGFLREEPPRPADLLSAFDKIQAECRAKFIERQDQHGSMSIDEMGLDDLMGVLKLKWARTKQQVHEGIQPEVFMDDLRDLAIYCHIVELKYTGGWNLPWKGGE